MKVLNEFGFTKNFKFLELSKLLKEQTTDVINQCHKQGMVKTTGGKQKVFIYWSMLFFRRKESYTVFSTIFD